MTYAPWALLLALGSLASLVAGPLASVEPPESTSRGPQAGPEGRGWSARASAGGRTVHFESPYAAFALEAGETLHPELPAADLEVVYSGVVRLPRARGATFWLEVEGGRATLDLRGRDVPNGHQQVVAENETADPLPGPLFGEIALVVKAERAGAGRFRLRVGWARQHWKDGPGVVEPLPSFDVHQEGEVFGVLAGERSARRGRALLVEKGCTNCHDAGESGLEQRAAPNLEGLGDRVNPAWVERWLRDLHAMQPGSDMPRLYGTQAVGPLDELPTLVRHLVGEEREAEALATEAAVLDEGRRLYHAVGCVACHGALASQAEVLGDDFLDDGVPDVAVRAPFGDLAGKWRPSALARFLLDPSRTHPDGRMPGMDLTQDACDRIATYLATEFGPAPSAPTPPSTLSELTTLAMCTACHDLPGWQGYAGSGDLADLDPQRGCLAQGDPRSPDYDLSERERADLRAGLASVRAASGAPAPLEALERRVDALGCFACHERDGDGGVHPQLDGYFQSADEQTDLGDEGRLPPDLTGLGAKLTSSWMHAVLVDGERDRTYLAARMPHYDPAAVGELAELFARREGLWPGSDFERPPSSDADRLAGRALMGRAALACVTCHSFGDLPPAGSPGPSIDRFAERLRYEWTMAYMCDPARYKRDTRMPSFLSDGRSAARDVLDGDFGRQVDAMWGYFELGAFMPAPPGLESGGGYTVPVGDRPVVLRTFLADAGSRGIAVGQPNGLHYSFDATNCRLVSVWRGDFLDASGAWAGRGGTVSGGRGENLWEAPGGPALWIGDEPAPGTWPDSADVRFRGYRLDADGYPTFLYEQDGARVELAIRPRYEEELEIVRHVRVEGLEGRLFTLRTDVTRPVRWRVLRSGEAEPSTVVVGEGPDRILVRTIDQRPVNTLEVVQ